MSGYEDLKPQAYAIIWFDGVESVCRLAKNYDKALVRARDFMTFSHELSEWTEGEHCWWIEDSDEQVVIDGPLDIEE